MILATYRQYERIAFAKTTISQNIRDFHELSRLGTLREVCLIIQSDGVNISYFSH